ncbi:MAG TPA: RNA polymerase subunit sigma-24 [Herpetosiphon sp.]|nr:sigma-70 family RNA polymerase sigma factor [Herpetosiphon sp.]HBW52347.1 RNA polymerase subunit sigma-24 [Herpetosiphon sp.]
MMIRIQQPTLDSPTNQIDFAELYTQQYASIYRYIAYRVRDPASTDDLVAHTFERAMTRIETYRAERGSPGAWIFGIARHCVDSYFQRQRRQRWLSLDFIREHVADNTDPIADTLRSETNQQLYQALKKLKAHERDVIALKFGAGLNNRQIAEITGHSESNVGVMLYRSLQRLRQWLPNRGYEQ